MDCESLVYVLRGLRRTPQLAWKVRIASCRGAGGRGRGRRDTRRSLPPWYCGTDWQYLNRFGWSKRVWLVGRPGQLVEATLFISSYSLGTLPGCGYEQSSVLQMHLPVLEEVVEHGQHVPLGLLDPLQHQDATLGRRFHGALQYANITLRTPGDK